MVTDVLCNLFVRCGLSDLEVRTDTDRQTDRRTKGKQCLVSSLIWWGTITMKMYLLHKCEKDNFLLMTFTISTGVLPAIMSARRSFDVNSSLCIMIGINFTLSSTMLLDTKFEQFSVVKELHVQRTKVSITCSGTPLPLSFRSIDLQFTSVIFDTVCVCCSLS